MATKAPEFSYSTSGRSQRALIVLACVYAGLLAAHLYLNAAPFILVIIALFTLPAIWDYVSDRPSGVGLDDNGLHWFSGDREARMPLGDIDHIRLDTRLDFSVRATVIDCEGRKARLPYECLPNHKLFEAALNAHGIRTERHHFSLL